MTRKKKTSAADIFYAIIIGVVISLLVSLLTQFVMVLNEQSKDAGLQEVKKAELCHSLNLEYQNGTNECYQIEGKLISYYKIEKIGNESYVNKLTELPTR